MSGNVAVEVRRALLVAEPGLIEERVGRAGHRPLLYGGGLLRLRRRRAKTQNQCHGQGIAHPGDDAPPDIALSHFSLLGYDFSGPACDAPPGDLPPLPQDDSKAPVKFHPFLSLSQ